MRKRHLTLLPALALLAALLVLVQQAAQGATGVTRCVAPGGAGGCYASIQDAINASTAGDDITIAAGTYQEHITLTDRVSIYGQGWDSTIIDGGFSAAQSAVRIPSDVSASTVLSGVKVTGGGTGDPATSSNGGGIAVWGSPRIVNTWVHSSTGYYGGGVYVGLGSPTFENVPAWENRALYGGGYYMGRDAEVAVTGNPFEGVNGTVWLNVAKNQGGGICVQGATVTLAGLRVYWNRAYVGGGMYVGNTPQQVTLVLNDISGNSAEYGGGISTENVPQLDMRFNAIGNWLFGVGGNRAVNDGGGAQFSVNTAGLVQSNLFLLNQATNSGAGGVAIGGCTSDLLLSANWFEGNSGPSIGGIHVYYDGAPRIDANTVVSNTGHGIYLSNAGEVSVTNNIVAHNQPVGTQVAHAVGIHESPGQVVNNTIADNTGSGLYLCRAEGAAVINNIISGNTGDGILLMDTTSYVADYNDLFGNPYNGLPAGAHDLAVDPQFVATGNLAEYYHIQTTSPVSSTGSPAWAPWYDIDGDWRAFGGSVSMGADEIPAGEELPAIVVAKTASAATAEVGWTITYTYRLTNTGNVGLSGVVAHDDRLGAVPLAGTDLAPAAWTTGTLTYTVASGDLPGPLANTVTVTGTASLMDPVTDTASFTVGLTVPPTVPGNYVYLPMVVRSAP
jgi:parallel beta-helix repeat protein